MSVNICRAWLRACRKTAKQDRRPTDAGCAVLGDRYGYTVEDVYGRQTYVGSAHCKYCARAEYITARAALAKVHPL